MNRIKKRNSIRVKYTLWMLMLMLSILLTTSIVGYIEYRRNYHMRHTEQAYTIGSLIASNIDAKNIDNYLSEDRYTILDILKNSLASMWGDMDINYVLLTDVDLRRVNAIYLRDGVELPSKLDDTGWRLETDFDQRYYTKKDSLRALDVVLPVMDQDGHIGAYVHTQISLLNMYRDIAGFTLKTLLGSLLISGCVLMLSLRNIRTFFVDPIIKVSKGTDLFASSHYEIIPELQPTFSNDEVDYLIRSINKMIRDIKEYLSNIERNIDEKEKMNAELRIAQHIQRALLPAEVRDTEGFEVYAVMHSADQVGGDFYDYFPVGRDRFAFLVGDVSGKGVPAALFMISAKEWIKNKTAEGLSPAEVFESVNETLLRHGTDRMFVTSWLGKVDLLSGVLTYVSAGHPPAMIKKRDGGFMPLVESRNKMLALFEDTHYHEARVQLEPGDTVFIYTDGVTEAERDQVQFGENKLRGVLDRTAAIYDNLEDFVRAVRYEVRVYEHESHTKDDLTMLAFRYHGKRQSEIDHIM